ncbi:MAG: virulence factor family protein [Proteobacteria bacterium]|nr:virulence factor family protein [Pseudomonadota bacterium]
MSLLLGAAAQAQTMAPATTLSHGLFSDVQVQRPAGDVRQFVLLVIAGDVPSAAEQRLAAHAVGAGAMVAVVPFAPFYRRLVAQSSRCTYLAGAFENLARSVQAEQHLPTYLLPMLVGNGSAAALVYAVAAQAPAGTFASVISAGFCPQLALALPPCAGPVLRWQAASAGLELLPATVALSAPWTALPEAGDAPPACSAAAAPSFVRQVPGATLAATGLEAAFDTLARHHSALAAPPAQLADLPVVEVPVAPGAGGKRFVVLLSGDGGWAGIDKSLAAAFATEGIPVAGLDSLRYFWSRRTPDGLAADLDRVVRYYAARWQRSDVILVGYSQGADVLPFALNRLPAATRAHVVLAALLGPGQKASFEFHVSNWIGPSGDLPIAPEAQKLLAAGTLCVYGETERDSLCPELVPLHARGMPLAGGHHFGGDYDALAARILAAAPR